MTISNSFAPEPAPNDQPTSPPRPLVPADTDEDFVAQLATVTEPNFGALIMSQRCYGRLSHPALLQRIVALNNHVFLSILAEVLSTGCRVDWLTYLVTPFSKTNSFGPIAYLLQESVPLAFIAQALQFVSVGRLVAKLAHADMTANTDLVAQFRSRVGDNFFVNELSQLSESELGQCPSVIYSLLETVTPTDPNIMAILEMGLRLAQRRCGGPAQRVEVLERTTAVFFQYNLLQDARYDELRKTAKELCQRHRRAFSLKRMFINISSIDELSSLPEAEKEQVAVIHALCFAGFKDYFQLKYTEVKSAPTSDDYRRYNERLVHFANFCKELKSQATQYPDPDAFNENLRQHIQIMPRPGVRTMLGFYWSLDRYGHCIDALTEVPRATLLYRLDEIEHIIRTLAQATESEHPWTTLAASLDDIGAAPPSPQPAS